MRLIVLSGLLLAQATAAWAIDPSPQFAPDEILVRFVRTLSEDEIRTIEARNDLHPLAVLPHLRVHHYRIGATRSVQEAVAALLQEPRVEYAEPNWTYSSQVLPSDPRFPQQWALNNAGQVVNGNAGPADVDIDWPEAMDLFSSSAPVTVAVIDSGVAIDHPDILNNTWLNPGEGAVLNGIDDDSNGFVDDVVGWDFFDDDFEPLDENGHGTLVASVIAGIWNDGVGISGVAPHARVMALRILDDFGTGGSGFVTDFVDASTYAASMGARIINFSAGHEGFSGTESAQLEWLDNQGVLLIAAAGNGGSDAIGDNNDLQPTYPASYDVPNIISAAAISRSGALAHFSNFGPVSTDLGAPGTDILGADLSRSIVWSENFEAGAAGWTVGKVCPLGCDSWAFFPDAFGNTWANDGSTHSILGPRTYLPLADTWMQSPMVILPLTGPQLTFRVWHDLALLDLFTVEVSPDGLSWDLVGGIVAQRSATDPPGTSLTPGSFLGVVPSAVELQEVAAPGQGS